MKEKNIYLALNWLVLLLMVFPIGIAVFILGMGFGDSPCIMCWSERITLIFIALIGLFMVRYGIQEKYIAWLIIVSLFGMFNTLRHIALYSTLDNGQGFSLMLFGARTYTWAFVMSTIGVIIAIVLLFQSKNVMPLEEGTVRTLSKFDRSVVVLFMVITSANAVQAFINVGPPPFMGVGNPHRFTFNPKNWYWSMEHYNRELHLFGPSRTESPAFILEEEIPSINNRKLQADTVLTISKEIALEVKGRPSAFDYNTNTKEFALTTVEGPIDGEIYLMDKNFQQKKHATLDLLYSSSLRELIGVTYLDDQRFSVMSFDKATSTIESLNEKVDPTQNYVQFMHGADQFKELNRVRVSTTRAKRNYVLSYDYDPQTSYLYAVSVPSERFKVWNIIKIDQRDMKTSEEFYPIFDTSYEKNKSLLKDLYITGISIEGDYLYALEHYHSSIIKINLHSHKVEEVIQLKGLDSPIDLVKVENGFYVLDGNKVKIY